MGFGVYKLVSWYKTSNNVNAIKTDFFVYLPTCRPVNSSTHQLKNLL